MRRRVEILLGASIVALVGGGVAVVIAILELRRVLG